MSKQNKKDRRQEIMIEIEALELQLINCLFVVEQESIDKKIKELNKELKSCFQ